MVKSAGTSGGPTSITLVGLSDTSGVIGWPWVASALGTFAAFLCSVAVWRRRRWQ
ncbi:MAG: hypothetical protein Q7R39_09085 [Dehalococcoidia bacterium]|nr:hypothetical protein [Dehalococcoidia bacterium]